MWEGGSQFLCGQKPLDYHRARGRESYQHNAVHQRLHKGGSPNEIRPYFLCQRIHEPQRKKRFGSGVIIPFDSAPQELRDAAHEFCKRELTLPEGETEWNLGDRLKAWIEVEDGEVTGVASIISRIDIV